MGEVLAGQATCKMKRGLCSKIITHFDMVIAEH